MSNAAVLLLLLVAGSCRASPAGIHKELAGTGHRALKAGAGDCVNFFQSNPTGMQACIGSSISGVCTDECKTFWAALSASGCFDFIKQFSPEIDQQWYETICNGAGPTPTASPGPSPSPDASPSPYPSPSPEPLSSPTPSGPGLNTTGWSSTFECNTSAGFQWITLNASLASMVDGVEGDPFGPAVALNSTCQDLNITGCCTQTPPANFTWVQYGLGQPMVVQGLKLTAPAGDCCADDACTDGSSPCNEQLVNAMIYVSNSSVADLEASPEYQQLLDNLKLAGVDVDVEAAASMYLWSLLQANSTEGLCNMVTNYDLFADGTTDGAMLNNGTFTVGCGLGLFGNGSLSFNTTDILGGVGGSWTAPGANLARKEPSGSWLSLVRLDPETPLAYCGLEVCAKPTTPAP